MVPTDITDRFLAIDDEFSPPMANALLHFRVTDEIKQRAAELAEKSNFGTITDEEKAEYLRLIDLDEIMAVLQAKARRFLSSHRP